MRRRGANLTEFWAFSMLACNGTVDEGGTADDIIFEEFAVPSTPQQPPAPFASLSAEPTPRQRWKIAQLFTAPFRDVDDRAFRLGQAARREREARQATMSDAAE